MPSGGLRLLLEVASLGKLRSLLEAEVELRLADVNGRRGTEDTVVAGSGFTRQATAVSQSTGTEGNLPSAEESDRQRRKMKQLPLEVIKAPTCRVIFTFVK